MNVIHNVFLSPFACPRRSLCTFPLKEAFLRYFSSAFPLIFLCVSLHKPRYSHSMLLHHHRTRDISFKFFFSLYTLFLFLDFTLSVCVRRRIFTSYHMGVCVPCLALLLEEEGKKKKEKGPNNNFSMLFFAYPFFPLLFCVFIKHYVT